MTNPWRLVEWTDEAGRVVKELAFHEAELREVLDLPFPPAAAAREPVVELTHFARAKPYQYFRRRWCPHKPGDVFYENINQAERLCKVLAVDEASGRILYDYEMPGGRVFMRIDGRPVSAKRLSQKWREMLT
jgi:hypothetical protein